MKIDLEMRKKFWFEDENGNEIETSENVCSSDFVNRKYPNGEVVY